MVRTGSPVRVRTRALHGLTQLGWRDGFLVPIAGGGVKETVCVADEYPELVGDVNLDLDRKGRLLGIEILGARRFLPPELLR